MRTIERLRGCFEGQRIDGLEELYAEDATLELHVGAAHDVYRGRSAIIARYAQDYAEAATFLRWDVREAPWGAVVEAAAVQENGFGKVYFRWIHLLVLQDGRISSDTVYCTGAVPAATVREGRVGG